MKRGWSIAVIGAVLVVASCTTTPQPPAPPPLRTAEPAPLPYRWTQGNAPQAYKDSVAAFGRLALRPGQYRWVTPMPEQGEARVVMAAIREHRTTHVVLHAGAWPSPAVPAALREWLRADGATLQASAGPSEIWRLPQR